MPTGNRLIFEVIAIFSRIDTSATTYDDDLREPTVDPADLLDYAGSRQRVDQVELPLGVQWTDEIVERLRAMASGDSPDSDVELTTHRRQARRAGILDTDGTLILGKQDRLVRVESRKGETLVVIPDVPGLYVHEVRPRSFGLSLRNSKNNLWSIHLRARDISVRR